MRSDGLETTGEVGRSSPATAGVDEHRKTEGDPTLDRQPAKVAKERRDMGIAGLAVDEACGGV